MDNLSTIRIKIPAGPCTLCYTVPVLGLDDMLHCECGHSMDPENFPASDKALHRSIEQAKAIRDEEGQ